MQRVLFCISALALCFVSSVVSRGQGPAAKTRRPAMADHNYFASLNSTARHGAKTRMSQAVRDAARDHDPRIITVPTFHQAFTFGGQVFPYTMIGRNPSEGRTTVIPTTFVPLSLIFDEFIDEKGNNIVIDAEALTDEIKHSPVFEDFQYVTGYTQFVDAMMRAQFFSQLKRNKHDDPDDDDREGGFHVLFTKPKTLVPVTIEVPVGSAIMFDLPSGNHFALIDINFLNSQLHTLLQTESITVDSIPIFLTRNAVFGDFFFGTPVDCCVGGFHGSFEARHVGNKTFVQTYVFSSSLDAEVADNIFRDPTIFADVSALSHELAEIVNDPFLNNITPNFQIPGAAPGVCQSVLEVGDILEGLPDASFPITLHNFTYHPQNEALLQWFAGATPSDAINGAYSFPDTRKLTAPFTPCPAIP
jgi:hypothetical protein